MIRVLAFIVALICAAPAIAQPLPANLDKQNAIVIDTTKAASSSNCEPTSRRSTPSGSSSWRAKAITTTCRSTA